MRPLAPTLSLCLLGLSALAGRADVPTIVQKFQQTLQSAPALSVTVRLTDADQHTDSGSLAFARPNRVRITSTVSGARVATVVSDGTSLWQWNTKYYKRRPAPASLADLSPSVALGPAANVALGAFLAQTAFGDQDALRDAGTVTLGGVRVHKVVGKAVGVTLWLADATGLPLKMTAHNAAGDFAATFTYPGLNRPLPDDTFAASPPPGLSLPPLPDLHNEDKLLAAGTAAPDFALPGRDGKKVSLSSLKGQVVVVDFWATWCGPCKKTMPHIQKLKDEMAGKGVTFLSVNTSDEADSLVSFLKANPQYTTTFLYDGGKDKAGNKVPDVAGQYNVTGIPTVYIIDAEGRVAASYVGAYDDEETMLKADLAQLGVQ